MRRIVLTLAVAVVIAAVIATTAEAQMMNWYWCQDYYGNWVYCWY